MATTIVNNFEIPNWAGKPPAGLHLDVLKDDKMIQKLMIDEKKCYFFGRNKQLCDFCIDHASSSRVHAALVWHKFLSRPFIIDLGSTHGTFIGELRLDIKKPQAVPMDLKIKFGASTRCYLIRERPANKLPAINDYADENDISALPETEPELDNLTEFNTAHNRRINYVSDMSDVNRFQKRKRSSSVSNAMKHYVSFNEDEEVINPEDIDPSIGRFRNLVQTTVILKKPRLDLLNVNSDNTHNLPSTVSTPQHKTQGHERTHVTSQNERSTNSVSFIAEKIGLMIPNLAADVTETLKEPAAAVISVANETPSQPDDPLLNEPKKKIYAKEAWPGKKSMTHHHSFMSIN